VFTRRPGAGDAIYDQFIAVRARTSNDSDWTMCSIWVAELAATEVPNAKRASGSRAYQVEEMTLKLIQRMILGLMA
jgi:hypothetical protein